MTIFNTPVSSTNLIILTVVYFICAAITTFDIRIIQAKKTNYIREDDAHVPAWTGLFGYLMWITWVVIFILNWWYAFVLFVLKFILKLLPVLENIGALLLLPVVGKETAAAVNTVGRQQKNARKKLKLVEENMKAGKQPFDD